CIRIRPRAEPVTTKLLPPFPGHVPRTACLRYGQISVALEPPQVNLITDVVRHWTSWLWSSSLNSVIQRFRLVSGSWEVFPLEPRSDCRYMLCWSSKANVYQTRSF